MGLFFILMTLSSAIAQSQTLVNNNEILCVNHDTSISCSGTYAPVCASSERLCSEPPCPQYLEFTNGCAACQNSMVTSYRNESCSRVCKSSDRLANCSTELIHPVCGITVDGCTSMDCQISFENSCAACSNSSIISYTPGLCPQQTEIACSTFSPSIVCEEGSLISVCATFNDYCDGVPCKETLESPCLACSDPTVVSFTPGPCSEDDYNEDETGEETDEEDSLTEDDMSDTLIYCPSERPTNCSLDFELVCAYFLIGCPEGVCSRTEVNGCTACQYPNVESYSSGRCEQEKLPCDPSSRPKICDQTPDPVCAYLINCVNGVCSETVTNSCTACLDPNVQLYVSGECPVS